MQTSPKDQTVAVYGSESILDLSYPVVCAGFAPYHIYEYFALKRVLEEVQGIPTVIICPVEPRKFRLKQDPKYLRRQTTIRYMSNITNYPLPSIIELINRSSALIVKTDRNSFAIELIAHAKNRGVPVIGWVESPTHFEFQDSETIEGADNLQYRSVDHVFCLGENDANVLANKESTIVGNQQFWEMWRQPPNLKNLPRATVNSNFAYRKRSRAHKQWLKSIATALQRVNLTWELSRHPAETGSTFPYRAAKESITELLKHSTHLVSQQSNVCYEALIRGVSLHFFGMHGSALKDPKNAYSVNKTTDELVTSLSMPELSPVIVRECAKSYLNSRLNLDSELSPAQSATSAILKLKI